MNTLHPCMLHPCHISIHVLLFTHSILAYSTPSFTPIPLFVVTYSTPVILLFIGSQSHTPSLHTSLMSATSIHALLFTHCITEYSTPLVGYINLFIVTYFTSVILLFFFLLFTYSILAYSTRVIDYLVYLLLVRYSILADSIPAIGYFYSFPLIHIFHSCHSCMFHSCHTSDLPRL